MSLSTLRGATATKAHGSKKAHIKTPIPLERPKERKYQKHEYISFKLKNNPGQANSGEYEFTIPFFHTGSPEETILLVQNISKIFLGLDQTTLSYRVSSKATRWPLLIVLRPIMAPKRWRT